MCHSGEFHFLFSTTLDLQEAEVNEFCEGRYHCTVCTEAGVRIEAQLIHIAGWQRISVDISERDEEETTSDVPNEDCLPFHQEPNSKDEQSLMQTTARAIPEFDPIRRAR